MEKIQTAGKWDRNDRNQFFLATDGPKTAAMVEWGFFYPYQLIATNEVVGRAEELMVDLEQKGVRWFIDSGVFGLAQEHAKKHGMPLNAVFGLQPEELDGFDRLFERYVSITRRWHDRAWGYIELDLGGVETKTRMRSRLERLGLRPVPVYHPLTDDPDYFDYLAKRYDRVCVGNMAMSEQPERRRLLATVWERKQKYPDVWVHVLGYALNEWILAYPVDSADGSSWMNAARFGIQTDRTMLRSIGKLPKDFGYVRGETSENGSFYTKASALSGYAVAMQIRNWHNHLALLRRMGLIDHSPGQNQ